jgi:hypothetical protein
MGCNLHMHTSYILQELQLRARLTQNQHDKALQSGTERNTTQLTR